MPLDDSVPCKNERKSLNRLKLFSSSGLTPLLSFPSAGEEEGSGNPQLTLTEGPCKRQEGSSHSSDVSEGKRVRRKPGSWWLINQDGDEEGGDDAVTRGRGHHERVDLARPRRMQRDRHASSKTNATGSSVEAVRYKAKENSTRSCMQTPAGWSCPSAFDRCHSTSQAPGIELIAYMCSVELLSISYLY